MFTSIFRLHIWRGRIKACLVNFINIWIRLPPLPPPSPFLSRPHSAFPSAISSSALGQRNNPPALWISLHTGLRKERRNEEKTGRDGANGRGNGEKEREREERGGWASFEKCWVKWEALDECADNVETRTFPKTSTLSPTDAIALFAPVPRTFKRRILFYGSDGPVFKRGERLPLRLFG